MCFLRVYCTFTLSFDLHLLDVPRVPNSIERLIGLIYDYFTIRRDSEEGLPKYKLTSVQVGFHRWLKFLDSSKLPFWAPPCIQCVPPTPDYTPQPQLITDREGFASEQSAGAMLLALSPSPFCYNQLQICTNSSLPSNIQKPWAELCRSGRRQENLLGVSRRETL